MEGKMTFIHMEDISPTIKWDYLALWVLNWIFVKTNTKCNANKMKYTEHLASILPYIYKSGSTIFWVTLRKGQYALGIFMILDW